MDEQIITLLGNLAISIGANVIYDLSKKIVKLLPHQESNLTVWLKSWNPSEEDIEIIKKDKKIQRIVSILFEKAENELFEEKLSSWGKITDNVIRNKKVKYNNDIYFIKLFSDMPLSVVDYLLTMSKNNALSLVGQYPSEYDLEAQEKYFCKNYCVCYSLTEVFSGNARLTVMGRQFLDFIGDNYQKTNTVIVKL
ncbi:MAG: hypothetical protein HDR54_02845 [Treponema sp.]|nr:hypothetical protein [Treponema sp.]